MGLHPRLLTRTAAFAAEHIALRSGDFVNGRCSVELKMD